MKIRSGAIAYMLVCLMTSVPAVHAQSEPKHPVRTLRLDAMGTVKAKPDTAMISLGVASEAETARAALDQNTAAMAKIIETLRQSEIAPEDIQTIDFSVRPRLDQSKDRPPVISGYRVVNSVRIVVRNLARLGETLDKAVSLGSNDIGGITFTIGEPNGLMDEARKRAMQNAFRKAQLFAEAAGTKLGRVLTIDEQATSPWRPQHYAAARLDAKSGDVPIQPGEAELQVNLSVMWELVD